METLNTENVMPDKYIPFIGKVLMTIASIIWGVTNFIVDFWNEILTIIPSVLAILYWVPKIKSTQVNKYHNGSWWKWFCAIPKFFKSKR